MPKNRDAKGDVGFKRVGGLRGDGPGEDRDALEFDFSREPEVVAPEIQGSFQDEFAIDIGFEMNTDDDGAWEPLGELLDGSDNHAPPRPNGLDEPPVHSRVPRERPSPDPRAVGALKRVESASIEPKPALEHLASAFRGESYDSTALPDARQIALGLGRYLVSRGHDPEALAEAIVAKLLR